MSVTTCTTGVWDCAYKQNTSITPCAPYDNEYESPEDVTWLVACAALIAAVMSFGIGANDSANSWGSSVGSGASTTFVSYSSFRYIFAGAITVRNACLLCGTFELLGAVTLGYGVSGTLQKGISSVTDDQCWACGYCNSDMAIYQVGMFAALCGAAVFLMLATFTSMPVSTTHAIVGGVVGVTLIGTNPSCLNWDVDGGLSGIVLSWMISPVFSGCIGSTVFLTTNCFILGAKRPSRAAVLATPWLYAIATFVMVFLIMLKSLPTKHLPDYVKALSAAGAALFVGAMARTFVVPAVKKDMLMLQSGSPKASVVSSKPTPVAHDQNALSVAQSQNPSKGVGGNIEMGVVSGEELFSVISDVPETMKGGDSEGGRPANPTHPPCRRVEYAAEMGAGSVDSADLDYGYDVNTTGGEEVGRPSEPMEQQAAKLAFRNLLVFVAVLESYAHGANDTANSTAAFTAVVQAHQRGIYACDAGDSPVWVMAAAGACVFVGVNVLGYRVIRTVGEGLVDIDYHRGFCIELASTLTVVLATILEMPVSSTHCQVGAVVFVGMVADGPGKVAWGMFGRIALTWLLTVPFSAGLAAGLTALLRLGITN